LEGLRKIWKNKYFRTIIDIVLALLIAFSLLLCLRLALGVEHPLLVVSSGSMMPTLNVGDLIIAQSIDPSQINADKLTGDILVFRDPRNPNELIVHRAVKIQKMDDHYLIVTSGDASRSLSDQFSPWDSSLLVGKVIMRVPYIGNLTLFLYSERNLSTIILLVIILVIVALIIFAELNQEETIQEETEKKPQRFNLHILYVIIVNILIIAFMIFSLWGSFTFWQPGATSLRRYVTVLGMYRDLQLHVMRYEDIYKEEVKAYLYLGFMTYRIDCQIDGGIRPGVPTFSWFQFSLLILILFDGWKLFDLIYSRLKRL